MLKIDFIYEVTDRIRNKMVGTCEVLIKRITHNNGQQLTGILFKKHGKESPLIYLDKYYDQYVDGRMSMVEIVDEIMRQSLVHCHVSDVVSICESFLCMHALPSGKKQNAIYNKECE